MITKVRLLSNPCRHGNSGTPLLVWRSGVEPLATRYPFPNTPGPTRGTGPRCGVSPGSTSFPWSPGPVASAGASFIREGSSGLPEYPLSLGGACHSSEQPRTLACPGPPPRRRHPLPSPRSATAPEQPENRRSPLFLPSPDPSCPSWSLRRGPGCPQWLTNYLRMSEITEIQLGSHFICNLDATANTTPVRGLQAMLHSTAGTLHPRGDLLVLGEQRIT